MGLFGSKKDKLTPDQFAEMLAYGIACNNDNRANTFDQLFVDWGELDRSVKFEWIALDAYFMWHAVRTWFLQRGNHLADETLAAYIPRVIYSIMKENPSFTDREQVAVALRLRTEAYENALLELWHEGRLSEIRGQDLQTSDDRILNSLDRIFGRFLLNREPEDDPKRRHLVQLAMQKMAWFTQNFYGGLADRFELVRG